jgi:hypothetical protein
MAAGACSMGHFVLTRSRLFGLCLLGAVSLVGCEASSPNNGLYVATDGQSGLDGSQTGDGANGQDVPLTPGSLKTCTASAQCAVNACRDNWSTTCGAACANATASAAATTASALLDCTTQQCVLGVCAGTSPPTQACMDSCTAAKCGVELLACWDQGATPGTKGCGSVVSCLTACDSDPQRFTCQAGCYTAASTAAQTQFKATSTCINKAGGDAGPCAAESLTCLGDGKTGSASCYDAQDCLTKCGNDDSDCQGSCFASGTSQAQNELVALLDCVTGPSPDNCLDETIVCASPSGSANCLDTASCAGACPTGPAQAACAMACLHKATPAAAQAFGELGPCMQKNCAGCQGAACQSCATSKCLTQALGCSGA